MYLQTIEALVGDTVLKWSPILNCPQRSELLNKLCWRTHVFVFQGNAIYPGLKGESDWVNPDGFTLPAPLHSHAAGLTYAKSALPRKIALPAYPASNRESSLFSSTDVFWASVRVSRTQRAACKGTDSCCSSRLESGRFRRGVPTGFPIPAPQAWVTPSSQAGCPRTLRLARPATSRPPWDLAPRLKRGVWLAGSPGSRSPKGCAGTALPLLPPSRHYQTPQVTEHGSAAARPRRNGWDRSPGGREGGQRGAKRRPLPPRPAPQGAGSARPEAGGRLRARQGSAAAAGPGGGRGVGGGVCGGGSHLPCRGCGAGCAAPGSPRSPPTRRCRAWWGRRRWAHGCRAWWCGGCRGRGGAGPPCSRGCAAPPPACPPRCWRRGRRTPPPSWRSWGRPPSSPPRSSAAAGTGPRPTPPPPPPRLPLPGRPAPRPPAPSRRPGGTPAAPPSSGTWRRPPALPLRAQRRGEERGGGAGCRRGAAATIGAGRRRRRL